MANPVLRAKTELAADAGEVRPVVVKLGGSVVRSGELVAWLDAIAAARCPIVVVPGGGALADEVRACQSELGFGDPAAHRMALLAMDQLAWAVAGFGLALPSARPRPSCAQRTGGAKSPSGPLTVRSPGAGTLRNPGASRPTVSHCGSPPRSARRAVF